MCDVLAGLARLEVLDLEAQPMGTANLRGWICKSLSKSRWVMRVYVERSVNEVDAERGRTRVSDMR